MAVMSPPSVDGIKDITLGELAVFNYLKATLPDSHYVWYDTMISNINPDFIILGPELGIVVLEVKDWDIRTIEKADANSFWIKGLKKALQNPLNQARNYARKISQELESNQALRQLAGKYSGNLKLNFGYAVVFSKITEIDFKNSPHARSIPDTYLLFKDDLINSDVFHLYKKLLQSIPGGSNFTKLDPQDIEVVKGIIGREPIPNIKNPPQPEPASDDKKAVDEETEARLSPEESTIYKKLKIWRKMKAKEENCVLWIIATNKNLIDLVKAHPTREDDLLMIKGFGQTKKEKYGRDIIEIIAGRGEELIKDRSTEKKDVESTKVSPAKGKNYLYGIGAGVLCAGIALGIFIFGSSNKETSAVSKPFLSVEQQKVGGKTQNLAETALSDQPSKPDSSVKADVKTTHASQGKPTSSTPVSSSPSRPSMKPVEGVWIKGNIREDGSKIYHMPGQKYYAVTKPEEWFQTEEEAVRAGYRKAKDSEAKKPVEGVWIKGNIGTDGQKIYHMPGQKYYSKVVPEAWFETEQDAINAGFRRSKR